MDKSKKIKLYLAVLNRGWIRRELVNTLLEMRDTKGVEITLENLNKTFASPICSNRNLITKRFLATDNDFLMMIDDDVLPLHNPAELVFADKDVIGSPAKVRQKGRNINWVAYVKTIDREGYVPVDFYSVDDTIDLLSVDIVGTGCILIKRKVLESIKAPFLTEFDEDGISNYGTDFAFCKRAKKAGFEIYTTPQRVCEHVKEVGLLDMRGYDDCDGRDAIAGKYAIPWGENAITQDDWHFIKNIIKENNVRTVLEFGSGLSSLLMSEIAEVDSFETEEMQKEQILSKTNGNRNMLSVMKWDGKKIDKSLLRSGYDMAFIDGPRGDREDAFKIATELAPKLIVHDAGRRNEQELQRKYLRNKYRLMEKNGWHLQRCHYWERRGIEVCFVVYQRPQRVPEILKQLKAQTIQTFKVNIWNNSGEKLDISDFPDGRVKVIDSKTNVGSQARFKLAKQTTGNPIIFFDDDENLDPNFVEYHYNQYLKFGAECILGSFTRTFNKESYWDSMDVLYGQVVDYVGTGGMVLDRDIIDKEPLLQKIPKPFDKAEDLYLCYLARMNHGLKLIRIEPAHKLLVDGKDQFLGLRKYKEEAFKKLRKMGWGLLGDANAPQ